MKAKAHLSVPAPGFHTRVVQKSAKKDRIALNSTQFCIIFPKLPPFQLSPEMNLLRDLNNIAGNISK